MISFSPEDQHKALVEEISKSIASIFPIEGKKNIIRLKKIYSPESLEIDDFDKQKKIKLAGGTWGVGVYGDIDLIDKATGKVIDSQTKVRLATVPQITHRFSYIVNGNEYQITNQLRRMPGIYTFRKQTGDQYKSVFNLEKGRNFDIEFSPKTLKFSLKIGQAEPPLYPFLKAVGVSDDVLEKAWGREILEANKKRSSEESVAKIAKAFIGQNAKTQDLHSYFETTKIDPEITQKMLGIKSATLTPQLIVKASEKLLNVYRGAAKPDDAESLIYKKAYGVEDYIKERILKNATSIQNKFKRNLDSKDKIKNIISPSIINNHVEGFFTNDERSNATEQYNPLHMLGNHYKVSIMGPGGISSEHMLTPEMREVHPSHVGFLDPIHTPESEKVGATLHMPFSIAKDKNRLLTAAYDTKKHTVVRVSPIEMYDKKVAFPDQAVFENQKLKSFVSPTVKVQHMGEMKEVPAKEVDLILPSVKSLFSFSSNLIPFLKNNQANRATFAAKQIEQAIPLVREHRDPPHVRTLATKSGITFNDYLGNLFSHQSPVDGKVTNITDSHIEIKSTFKTHKVPIYKDFPLNQNTLINSEPIVKIGDKVEKGQIIADTNYTKNGTLALGTNLRTAYMVWPGATFEDGIAISESAAKKLTSEHIYKHELSIDENTKLNLRAYKLEFPNALKQGNADKLDDDGVIKKGSIVRNGDTLIAAMQKRTYSPEEIALMKTHRSLKSPMANHQVVFQNEHEGVVTDVIKTPKIIRVIVKTKEPAMIGDKLSGLHGNKGIISAIIPDNQVPRNKNGEPVEVMFNPHGVISRINIGQIYESAASKLAKATGSPYKVENFDNTSHKEKIQKELQKHGISDKEELFDPSGKSLGLVHVGNPHIIKLFKTGQSVISARGAGAGYAYDRMNKQPVRGGEEGAKSIDLLTNYSLLSHNARNILKEMATIKGEQNDDFWLAFRQGRSLPAPRTPFVFNKFISMLQGAGINVEKNGTQYKIIPQTDQDVLKISRGPIKEPEFINSKDLKPRKGGFFDEKITGGFHGTQFNHIELPEKLPNPVFEDAIKKLTGLKDKEYIGLISGSHSLDNKGKVVEGAGLTGGKAFEVLLKKIDVNKTISDIRKTIDAGKATDDDFKKLRILNALKENNLTPHEAYLKSVVPVLPPIYRPIYPIKDGSLNVSQVNNLYQHTSLLVKSMNLPAVEKLPTEDKGIIKHDLYKSIGAIAGIENPISERGREHTGLIGQIAGSQPKEGFFLGKVIRKQQDLTARGTIIPNSDLHVDEVGIPEKAAWRIFEPFIVQKLVRQGKTPATAKVEIENRTDTAKRVLQEVLNERPILINRAPSLHKFSIMAAKPKLVSGNAIHIPHLVVKGFGADFDGDAMTIHVPISQEAVNEAKNMFPSKNLFKPGAGDLMLMPSQEGALGTFILSHSEEGRRQINQHLPEKFHVKEPLDVKKMNLLFKNIAKEAPSEFPKIVQNLKNLSEKITYQSGFTIGLEDLHVISERDKILKNAEQKASALKKAGTPEQKIYEVYQEASKKIQEMLFNELPKNNPLRMMVESGARGNKSQLQQITATPVILKDTKDRPILIPIKKSYTEGLDLSDYIISLYGARKGMMDRALQTSLPGAFTKDLMTNVVENVVSKHDCGTKIGVEVPISSGDALDRYTAHGNPGIPENTLVTPEVIKKLEKSGVKTIKVRSPLKCIEPKGVCAKCFGPDEHGQLPYIGRNLGTLTGQALTEPLTQMQMKSIHSGGMAGAQADAVGFEKIQQLFNLPKHMTGVVPLAESSGKVKKIEQSPGGGHVIHVGDDKYHVPVGAPILHKVGDSIEKGEPLALGPIHPVDILKHKGIEEARNYLVDQLQKTYKDQGANVHRKFFENIVRTVTNTTKIKNAPEGAPFMPGDIAPLSAVQAYNAKNKNNPIIHAPTLVGLTQLPMTKKNWMAQLGYRYIKSALKTGAREGWTSDVSDYHPIPAFAYGATFGAGKEGRY